MDNRNLPCLLTVRQFAAKHPAFSEGSLRWLIFQANSKVSNNDNPSGIDLDEAIIRVGRRVLIHENKFFACIESINNA